MLIKCFSYYEWNCPKCDEFHMAHVPDKYCSHCGQAIDWSEDDNCQN
nr:MAG TPA: DNA-directed RNA polymerase [Caudoviricetes sp.]